eukprot:scaffold4111_cov132-Isochrysis_galbana.AAC.6
MEHLLADIGADDAAAEALPAVLRTLRRRDQLRHTSAALRARWCERLTALMRSHRPQQRCAGAALAAESVHQLDEPTFAAFRDAWVAWRRLLVSAPRRRRPGGAPCGDGTLPVSETRNGAARAARGQPAAVHDRARPALALHERCGQRLRGAQPGHPGRRVACPGVAAPAVSVLPPRTPAGAGSSAAHPGAPGARANARRVVTPPADHPRRHGSRRTARQPALGGCWLRTGVRRRVAFKHDLVAGRSSGGAGTGVWLGDRPAAQPHAAAAAGRG